MTDRPLVLLVEDNPPHLELARDVLGFAGFTVAVAGSGEDGVALPGEYSATWSARLH